LLRKLGLDHERHYLRQLAEKDGLAIVKIDVDDSWDAAVAETVKTNAGRTDHVSYRMDGLITE
jgi:phage I-like protein